MSSSMRESGGADFLTVMASTRRLVVIYLLEFSKTDLSTERVFNITAMGIITRDNILTECLRALGSIFGQMAVHTKVTSSRVKEVDMEFGRPIRIGMRGTVGTTPTIRRQDMEYILGTMDGNTKEISKVTIVMVMDSYMTHREMCNTKAFGRMVSRQTEKPLHQTNSLGIPPQRVDLAQIE